MKIPEADRTLRLIEHPTSHFAVPPGRGEKFKLVEVTMFSGRSMGAKRTLYQAIVRNLAALDVPSHDIKITLIESPPENWGLRGGMPASEIDFGFKIDVSGQRFVEATGGLDSARDKYRTVLLPSWTLAVPTSTNPNVAWKASDAGFGGLVLTSQTTRFFPALTACSNRSP